MLEGALKHFCWAATMTEYKTSRWLQDVAGFKGNLGLGAFFCFVSSKIVKTRSGGHLVQGINVANVFLYHLKSNFLSADWPD